jgi:hypothetical protein
MKLKGRRFEPESDIQRSSTALTKITSTVHLKRGENNGIPIYVPKKTVLKEMAAKIKQVKAAFIILFLSWNFLIAPSIPREPWKKKAL